MGRRLKLQAKVDAVDTAYFRDVIKPLLADPLIEFVGEIGDTEKAAFLGNAKALLFPIDWPEPFGLVLIEAMACGTPAIAWRCGSVTEIVDDGKTGFIVGTEDEVVEAVYKLDQLDRLIVRRVFQERFTADVMARNYLPPVLAALRNSWRRPPYFNCRSITLENKSINNMCRQRIFCSCN